MAQKKSRLISAGPRRALEIRCQRAGESFLFGTHQYSTTTINIQQPQTRLAPTHDDTKTLHFSPSADASRVRALLFDSCMPCFAHDPIKLRSHSDDLIINKCTAFVLVQCLGGEYAYVRCAASSRDWFFGTFCRRAGGGASSRSRRRYRQRRTEQCHLGQHARRSPNRPSTAQIEIRPEYGRGWKNRYEGD